MTALVVCLLFLSFIQNEPSLMAFFAFLLICQVLND